MTLHRRWTKNWKCRFFFFCVWQHFDRIIFLSQHFASFWRDTIITYNIIYNITTISTKSFEGSSRGPRDCGVFFFFNIIFGPSVGCFGGNKECHGLKARTKYNLRYREKKWKKKKNIFPEARARVRIREQRSRPAAGVTDYNTITT